MVGATLFCVKFSLVPSPKCLVKWVAVNWALCMLRSYDIAIMCVEARKVYSLQGREDGTRVEIFWQELVNFDS